MSRAPLEVFGLSFLDVICCGLGAVLALFVFLASQLTFVDDALPASVDDAVKAPDTFFSLSARCRTTGSSVAIRSLHADGLRVASDAEAPRPDGTALLTAFRDGPNANFSPLRIAVVTGLASASLDSLRDALRDFSLEQSKGHQDLVTRLAGAFRRIAAATNEEDWRAAVAEARKTVEDCNHRERRAMPEQALNGLDDAWVDLRDEIAESAKCEIELVTSGERKQVVQAIAGRREVCVSPRGPFYVLDLDCRQ